MEFIIGVCIGFALSKLFSIILKHLFPDTYHKIEVVLILAVTYYYFIF